MIYKGRRTTGGHDLISSRPTRASRCASLRVVVRCAKGLDVQIDAKIAAGYFTSGKKVTTEDLVKTVGRTWEETDH